MFRVEKIDGFENQLDLVNSESSMILFTFIVNRENALAFEEPGKLPYIKVNCVPLKFISKNRR